MKAIPDPPGYK